MIVNVSARSITLLLAVGAITTSSTSAASNNLRQRRASLFHSSGGTTKNAKKNVEASKPPEPPAAKPEEESPAAPKAVVTTKKTTNKGGNKLRGAWNGDMPKPSTPVDDTSDDYKREPTTEVEAVEGGASSSVATASSEEPSFTLTKNTYLESESITATFSVGSPTHPYYSSSEVPTLNLDYNYPQWSVGLYMRDADPQGGTLSPIVSINLCGALGSACDASNINWETYGEVSVTFGDESLALMEGKWPLMVSEYGTGFDAYVLDANGAGAIGPLEFYINSDENMISSSAAIPASFKGIKSSTPETESENEVAAVKAKHGLAKYNHAGKHSTHGKVEVDGPSGTNTAVKVNNKLNSGNGVSSIGGYSSIHGSMSASSQKTTEEEEEIAIEGEETATTEGQAVKYSITSTKEEYGSDEAVTLDFSLDTAHHADLSNYSVGIFMRMANPQGGALDPVVSLPVSSTATDSTTGVVTGSVTFSSASYNELLMGTWPIDLYQWGTGFDAYVLNEVGGEVVGPVKFNIMIDDTY